MILGRYHAVDLTHPLTEKVPTWSGGCGFRLEIKMDYEEGLRVQSLKSHAGVGTHMDAPAHFFREGKTIGQIPLGDLITPLCILDLREKRAPDLFVQKEDVFLFEKEHGKIPKKALVAALTGWGEFWHDSDRYRNPDATGRMHFPGFSKESALELLKRDISGLGIDTLSPDGSSNGKGQHLYPVHTAILGAGKYILENLAHLDQMPVTGGFAICLPPRAMGASEFACRILGLWEPGNIPNEKTRAAMEDARKGKTKQAKDFDDLSTQLGI